MRTPKVSTSFLSFTDANLETKAQLILASMTGNPAFANHIPTLAELQAAVAQVQHRSGGRCCTWSYQCGHKNASRQILENILSQLGIVFLFIFLNIYTSIKKVIRYEQQICTCNTIRLGIDRWPAGNANAQH